jgi:hypothetical protein
MADVELELLPAQRELVESEAETVAFVGGYGSGKSRALAIKALVSGLTNAPCTLLFVMPTFGLLRDATVPTFQELFDMLGISYRYLANDHIFLVENGPESFKILLRSGERPEALVGSNVASAFIDEPALQDAEVYKRVIARVRDPKAKLLQTVLGGTPEGAAGWFYDMCQMSATHVIRARTTDNIFLPEGYVRNLASKYTAAEYEAYINGQFVSFDGAWYTSIPSIAPFEDWNGCKLFRQPGDCSSQLVAGVDTSGGLGRDSGAIALVDKKDRKVVATWKSSTATIDEMGLVCKQLFAHYTKTVKTTYPGLLSDKKELGPLAVIERNGIGQATYQTFIREHISCSGITTTDATRYSGLQAVRNAASDGTLTAGEDLSEEARLLTVVDGKFVGPKDLSMAIGFAYNWIQKNPFVEEKSQADRSRAHIESKLGKGRVVW